MYIIKLANELVFREENLLNSVIKQQNCSTSVRKKKKP